MIIIISRITHTLFRLHVWNKPNQTKPYDHVFSSALLYTKEEEEKKHIFKWNFKIFLGQLDWKHLTTIFNIKFIVILCTMHLHVKFMF